MFNDLSARGNSAFSGLPCSRTKGTVSVDQANFCSNFSLISITCTLLYTAKFRVFFFGSSFALIVLHLQGGRFALYSARFNHSVFSIEKSRLFLFNCGASTVCEIQPYISIIFFSHQKVCVNVVNCKIMFRISNRNYRGRSLFMISNHPVSSSSHSCISHILSTSHVHEVRLVS